jgi:hypothetical protein
MNDVFKKLNYKNQNPILIQNAPDEFSPALAELAGGSAIDNEIKEKRKYSFSLTFAKTRIELEIYGKRTVRACTEDAVLWFAYPKKTSKRYMSDLSRDTGWEPILSCGLRPVRQVAMDEDWSALRFKRKADLRG